MKDRDLGNYRFEILIVEDSPTQAEELKYALERQEFDVKIACNGVEALSKIRERKPTMVISDIIMPEMDGYQLCRKIKDDGTLKDIPVILLTALSDPRDVVRGLECGADNFITKPYNEKSILSRIQYILANMHLKDAGQTQFGVEVILSGEKYFIKSDRIQILNLLLSSYETAIQKNGELTKARDELRTLSNQLEQMVKERTAELSEEIKERKKTEEALRESEKRYKVLLDSVTDYIYSVSIEDGRPVTTVHGAGCTAVTGFTPEEYESDPFLWHRMIHEQDRPAVMDQAERILAGEPVSPLEHRITHRDGSLRWVRNTPVPVYDRDGRLIACDGLISDITDRKTSEEALRDSQSFIRNILETVDEGFIVVDPEYRIISANKAFCAFFNIPETEVLGRYCFDVSHHLSRPCFESGESCAVKDTFESGNPQTVTHTHTSLGDEKRNFEIKSFPVTDLSGSVISVIETINDITERRKLEEQLRQSQKMEALGTLVGGVAHDFNNIITAIIGFGSLAQKHTDQADPRALHLQQIVAAADRAASLTRSLLTFCRKQEIQTRPVNLNEIVRNVEKMLTRLLREDIEMDISLTEFSMDVMVDEGQIQQVLMNLATNARDAMPEGGKINISSAPFVMDEEFIKNHGFGMPGEYALLMFSDSGSGMDENTRRRIFEPFFTTKEVGKGTGLGLSICYGIITQHNGYINCYSEPGSGTTIRIYLPRIDVVEDHAKTAPLPALLRGDETILLAEDDVQTREITRIILEDFGYRVIEATNGDEAVTAFAERKDEIRLVIIDMIMPKRNGKEVYEEINKIRPGVMALFTSGYPADVFQNREIVEKRLHFIAKPVTPTALLQKVREVLSEP